MDGVGVEVAGKAVGSDFDVRMVGRERARVIEGAHDALGRLARLGQLDADRPLVRAIEPVVAEPDDQDGSVVQQAVEIPPLEGLRALRRPPAVFPDRDLLADAERREISRRHGQMKLLVVGRCGVRAGRQTHRQSADRDAGKSNPTRFHRQSPCIMHGEL